MNALDMATASFQSASRAVTDSEPADLDKAHLMKAIGSALDFARVATRALEDQLGDGDDLMAVAHALQVERFRRPR